MSRKTNGATPAQSAGVRCAIYTRKSTEEGLEQEFNSLDAQRESAEAYIKSQQHEGWHNCSGQSLPANEIERFVLDQIRCIGRDPAVIGEAIPTSGQRIAYPDFYAQDAMVLFKDGGYGKTAFVQAVSPSSATVTHAMADVASRIMTTGGVRRFRHLAPNDLSLAVHVRVGGLSLLLGSDLENTDDAAFGWKAVLVSPSLPFGKSQVFKVAHHGSSNADDNDVWATLLGADPVSVVTSFSRLAQPLPSESDIERIKRCTRNLLCTTWPPSVKLPKRRGVDKLVETATKTRWAMNRKPGFVRIRIDLSTQTIESPKIQTFGSATTDSVTQRPMRS